MNYLKEFFILVACLWCGAMTKSAIPFPIPESVYGMLFLFLFIMIRLLRAEDVEKTAHFLLGNLAFYFVPTGVQIMTQYSSLKGYTLRIAAVMILSTALTMVVTAKVVQWMQRRRHVQ